MVLLQRGGAKFPFNREVLGCVLGPATGAGNEMAQWVLEANGNVVPRRTLYPLKVDELHSPTKIKKRETFNALIERRWGTLTKLSDVSIPKDDDSWKEYHDNDESPRLIPNIEDTVDVNGRLLCQQPA